MTARFPTRLRALLIVEGVLALLFWLLAWDHTVSLAQGRPARAVDIAALALPLALVVVLGIVAVRLWHGGNGRAATMAALLPFPLALVGFSLLGAI